MDDFSTFQYRVDGRYKTGKVDCVSCAHASTVIYYKLVTNDSQILLFNHASTDFFNEIVKQQKLWYP